jgi:hypothetical protein
MRGHVFELSRPVSFDSYADRCGIYENVLWASVANVISLPVAFLLMPVLIS